MGKRVLSEEQILKRIRKRKTYQAFVNLADHLIKDGIGNNAIESCLHLIHKLYNRRGWYKYRKISVFAEQSLEQYIKDLRNNEVFIDNDTINVPTPISDKF